MLIIYGSYFVFVSGLIKYKWIIKVNFGSFGVFNFDFWKLVVNMGECFVCV